MGNAAAISRKAHKVVEVLPGSPGDMCGLKAVEDFIIAIDGRDLMKIDANEMLQIVKNAENRDIDLTIFNTVQRSTHVLQIRPSRYWLKSQSASTSSSGTYEEQLLGITVILTSCEAHMPLTPSLSVDNKQRNLTSFSSTTSTCTVKDTANLENEEIVRFNDNPLSPQLQDSSNRLSL
jgi:C-terminal processing protease CtpA/Prc